MRIKQKQKPASSVVEQASTTKRKLNATWILVSVITVAGVCAITAMIGGNVGKIPEIQYKPSSSESKDVGTLDRVSDRESMAAESSTSYLTDTKASDTAVIGPATGYPELAADNPMARQVQRILEDLSTRASQVAAEFVRTPALQVLPETPPRHSSPPAQANEATGSASTPLEESPAPRKFSRSVLPPTPPSLSLDQAQTQERHELKSSTSSEWVPPPSQANFGATNPRKVPRPILKPQSDGFLKARAQTWER